MRPLLHLSLFLFLFISLARNGYTQHPENLVFEGAGIRGLAYGGVIEALNEQGHLDSLQRVGGTSAGAVTALLLSLRYEPEEIIRIIESTPWESFNDAQVPFLASGVYRMNKHYGWYPGDQFHEWIASVIALKTGSTETTFAEARNAGFLDLYVTATSVNRQELVYLSVETYPEMRLSDAMRIAISIPFYFEAVPITAEGEVVEDPSSSSVQHLLIDGGLLANYPIHMFDRSDGQNSGITIGVRMDTPEQIDADQQREGLVDLDINSLQSYTEALYVLTLETLSRNSMSEDDWSRTISVSTEGIGPRIRELSMEERRSLIESGKKAVDDFLND
ncbi:patatin-like phospholipase family protein [Sanyastnella coralliicola]|uniref:patatin-like phospholipase family protein n=1 Tax=Sanyastnella coralliicola TaxID=3069118 RepID=UPI0027BA230C|nr:patatin-like phospholipase family protein [Longitalea sp. SCSIO 12813]